MSSLCLPILLNSPSRPTLASRQSHKAFLTFNSPLIAAEAVSVATNLPIDTTPQASVLATPREIPKPLPYTTHIDSEPITDESSPRSNNTNSHSIEPSRNSAFPSLPLETGTNTAEIPTLQAVDGPVSNRSKNHNTQQSIGSEAGVFRNPQSPRLVLSPAASHNNLPPATLVTPPTPTFGRDSYPKDLKRNTGNLSANKNSASQKGITHRRTRSATAASSKLANQFSALTPTIEENKTPGESTVASNSSGGFFSSVFSATQNAVNQLSNTFQINNTPGQRSRSGTSTSEPDRLVGAEEVILTSRAQARDEPTALEPAVKTLGSGNLSLSHLGISDSHDHSPMSSQFDIPGSNGVVNQFSLAHDDIVKDEAPTAATVDPSYSEKAGIPIVNDSVSIDNRPLSVNSAVNSIPGDQTPPRKDAFGDGVVLHRSGSVRSRFSGRKKKRSRGSSAATGSAIAAALASSSNALVNPGLGAQRITGFAVASSKRNKDFHTLFKSVPEDDLLIEDYSAALQRDILLHGRMYVSERHICFSSNILGWQTNLVMSFDEVVAMEKKSTAMIFPNAIVIQTLHAKNIFASFLSRDPTYDLLIGIWKIGHPNLRSSDNGHVLDDQAKSEIAESIDDDDGSDGSDYSGEDGDSQEPSSFIEATSSIGGSEYGEAPRVPSHRSPATGISPTGAGSPSKGFDGASSGVVDFPGPSVHSPTECADQDNHFEKEVVDTTIPAPLGRVYDMMFGPKSGVVMKRFLVDDQNSRELELEDDKIGMGETIKTFAYSYIKPLNSSIGPKQTKCLVTQTLDSFDLEKAISVTCSTQTPDVPSGNMFVTKTKYCLMWGPGNSTRFIMNSTVEWSGKSWLKGPIEKGASDGQAQYGKDIVRFFTAQVTARAGKTPKAAGKIKGRKKRSAADMAHDTKTGSKSTLASKDGRSGLGLLGPIGDILGPLITPVTGLIVLVAVMTVLWLRAGSSVSGASVRFDREQHMTAYEDMWRKEENQLWAWLESRLELDEITPPLRGPARPAASRLEGDHTTNKQVEEAIRVTEERLEALKRSRGL